MDERIFLSITLIALDWLLKVIYVDIITSLFHQVRREIFSLNEN